MHKLYYIEIYQEIEGSILTVNDVISFLEIIVKIIVGIVAIIGGVIAIMYFRKMREKRLNASFCYLSRLKVRINYLYNTFSDNSEDIIYRFIPEAERRLPDTAKSLFINNIIKTFSNNANETLNFLKQQDDQMPSKRGWTKWFDVFIDFLEDCQNIGDEKYFKWNNLDKNKMNEYITLNLKNMKKMLDSIIEYQIEVESKICKN